MVEKNGEQNNANLITKMNNIGIEEYEFAVYL